MRAIGQLGEMVWAQWDDLRHGAAVIGTVLGLSVRPWHWVRTVRTALARQILVIGVEPLWFVGALAIFVGLSVRREIQRDEHEAAVAVMSRS